MNSSHNNTKRDVILYFQVHQPWRLRSYSFFDIGHHHDYFNNPINSEIALRVAAESYLPSNEMLLNILKQYPQIKITFSISGTAMDQLHEFCPSVLTTFRKLAETGQVEFLGETAYHSLSSTTSSKEFEEQVLLHSEKLSQHLNVRPTVFRNTELIYDNTIAKRVSSLGFRGMLLEGTDRLMQEKNNHVFHHPEDKMFKLFPRNYSLSDDIAFRFNVDGRTLSTGEFIRKMKKSSKPGDTIMLGMDYETFGEHKKQESGVLEFLEDLLVELGESKEFRLTTPSEALDHPATTAMNIQETTSWADADRDLSAWLANDMQQDVFQMLERMESCVKNLHDSEMLETWRRLMSSDHFYYLSTKKGPDGEVHSYFSPYPSPYDAFMNFMNVVHDFHQELKKRETQLVSEPDGAVKHEAELRSNSTPVWAQKLENSYG
jgi:alpha-amylase